MYKRIDTNIYLQAYRYKHLCTSVKIQTFIYKHIETNIYVQVYRYKHLCTSVQIQTFMYKRIETNIYVQAYRNKHLVLHGNIDQTPVNSLHRLLNCEKGG